MNFRFHENFTKLKLLVQFFMFMASDQYFDFLNLSRQYYPNLALLKLYFETDLLFWQLVSVFTAFS